MFGFSKKKNKPTVCNHKWKDFPWCISTSYYNAGAYGYSADYRYTLKIKEPYVCIKCKARRDELLMEYEYTSAEKRDKKVKELQAQYPDKIRPIVEVEDMVRDEILVDREYLRLIEEFDNPTDRFAGLDLFAEIQKAKKEAAAVGVVTKIGEENEKHK